MIQYDSPRFTQTCQRQLSDETAIRRGGLLYRYIPDESPDGLPGHEGAFLICSFGLVDNLAKLRLVRSQTPADSAVRLQELGRRTRPL